MLARCLDVGSMSHVLQFSMIWGADFASLFGMLVAPTLAPRVTIEGSRGTWEHKKGDVGVQVWISVDHGCISRPHFDSC